MAEYISKADIHDPKGPAATGVDEAALDALEHHYRDNGQLAELFRTYRDVVAGAGSPRDVQTLRLRLARFLGELVAAETNDAARALLRQRRAELLARLGDADGATTELALAFGDLPDEGVLDRIVSGNGDLEGTDLERPVLEARMKLAEDPARRAAAARRLGTVLMGQGELDPAEAAFRVLLDVEPDDAQAREAVESIAATRDGRREMIDSLRKEVAAATSERSRSRAWLALAEALQDDPSAAGEAEGALRSAVQCDPANPDGASRLLAAAVKDRAWVEVRKIGEAWIAAADPSVRADAFKATGLALMSAPKQREIAIQKLEEAFKLRPSDREVVDGLDEGLTSIGRGKEVIAHLQAARRVAKARDDERRWLVREAEVVWKTLGDLEEAEKIFRRVRAADPRDMTALLFYEDYLTQKEDWKRLHAVLSQKFTLVPASERVDVAIQMAALAEKELGSQDKAIEAYKRVLAEDPANARATEQLVQLYKKSGKWHALIEFLNAQVRRLDDVKEADHKVALLFQIIEIYQDPDRLPVEEMVIHTYNRIVQISPTNVKALDNLAQRYEDARRWSELVQVLQKKIEATTDEDTLLDLFHQVADLYVSKMSSEGQAIPFLERILELDPTNLEVVRKLRSIYKSKHNLERLYATYEAELRLVDGAAREPILTELAVLATDKLYWLEDATRHWEELLALNPKNEKAVTSLQTLYAEAGQWDRFVSMLEARLEHARTTRKRLEVLERLGQIRFEKLGQLEEAKTVYREILQLQASHLGARKALQRLHIAQQDWDELKALYAEHQDWKGYVQFLDETCAAETDPALRTEIQLECARVFEDKLKDVPAAVGKLEQVLAADETNMAVAKLLDERYGRLGLAEKRIAVLGLLARHSAAPADVAAALHEGVALFGELDRFGDAFDWACRAAELEIDDGRFESGDRLESAAELADRWDDLAAWYASAAARAGGIDEKRELLLRQAQVLRERLRKNADAIAAYEELIALDESDWTTLKALEDLTYSVQDWAGFERTLWREVTALEKSKQKTAVAARRACLLKLGQLYEDITDDPDQAVHCYRTILEQTAGESEAVDGLDRIFQRESRWEDLLALLEGELARSKGADAVDLEVRVASVLHHRLSDSDGAIARLEAALGKSPDHAAAVALLNDLFDDGESRERVGALLDPVLRRGGDWARLAEVLTDRLAQTEEPADRRALLGDIAALREQHLGDALGAFALVAEQVALAPSDPASRGELERLAESLGRWSEVSRLYGIAVGFSPADVIDGEAPFGLGDAIQTIDDALDNNHLTARLAEIYEAQLEELERATECYERVLAFDPADMSTLAALERLHARREDFDALLHVYRTKVELIWEVDAKKAVYLDICALLREELGRPEEAIDYYRSILAIDENDGDVIGELEELYAQFERWGELTDLLRRRLIHCQDKAERIGVLFELAVIYRDRLEDVHQAIDTFAAILGEDATHADSIDALEALLLREDLPDFEAFAPRVADIIEPWLASRGQWEREVGVLRVRARLVADDTRRASHLRAAGERYEQKGADVTHAFECYSEAFLLDPGNAAGAAALERVSVALEAWADLAKVLEEAVREDEPTIAVPILVRVGALCRGELHDEARAVLVYERVLTLDPVHPGALAALDELYGAEGRTVDRVSVLERRAETVDDEAQRRAFLFEAGRLHEELGRIDEAIDAFSYVAEHGDAASEPIARNALDRLQALYEATERWLPLVQVLLEKAETEPASEDKKAWMAMAAQVQEEKQQSPEEAVLLYERIREMDPDDGVAFENLRRLLSQAERWEDLETLLLDARARATEDANSNFYDFMLGQIYDYRLHRRADAIDRYEAILDRAPDFAAALSALGDALDDADHGLRASEILTRAHLASDNAESLAGILVERLTRWPGDVDVSATHIQLAQLHEHRFGDNERAFDSLCQAVMLAWKEPPALRGEVVRLARITGRWEDLEIALREVLGGLLDRKERIELLMEMARIAQSERRDLGAAETIYREALDEDPGQRESLEALRSIYEETDRFREMIEILRLQAEFAGAVEEKIGLLYQIGGIQQYRIVALTDAVSTFEQVLAERATERDAYRAMAAIHEQMCDWEAVVGVLGRQIDVETDAAEILGLRRRMAEILLEQVKDRDRALDVVDVLLEADPSDAVALRVLESCHEARHAYDRVIALLIPLYELYDAWDKLTLAYRIHAEEGDTPARLWAFESMRRIQVERTSDVLGAFETLKELTRLTPEDPARYSGLEDAAAQLGRWADLVAFYETLYDDDPDSAHAVTICLRAARIHETQLGSRDDAIRLYRQALDADPTSGPAQLALAGLYEATERWSELVQLRELGADITLDSGEKMALLFEAARLYEEKLDQPADAAGALRRILDDHPDSREALGRLEGLLRGLERWDEVEELHRQWVDVAEASDETVAVRFRLASFLVDQRGNPLGALEEARKIVEDQPDHTLTVHLLERMLGVSTLETPEDTATLRSEIADLLEYVYPVYTRWERWAAVFQAQLAVAAETAHRVALRRKLGALYLERAEDPHAAFAEYAAAFLLDYGNPEIDDLLERLAKQHQLAADLVRVYEQGEPDAPSAAVRERYLLRVAVLLRDVLAQPGQAAARFERLLEASPGHPEAIAALQAHYEGAEAWDDLTRILRLRLDVTDLTAERVAILYRLADLQQLELGHDELAIAALSEVLDLEPAEALAKDRLEALYAARQSWDELIDVYRRKLDYVSGEDADGERIELLGKTAQVQERMLGRLDDAISTFREVLAISPQNLYAMTSLERLFPLVQDHEGLLGILEQKRLLFASPRDRVEVDFLMGALLFDRLKDPERALQSFRLVLEHEGDHEATVRYLERLLDVAEVRIPTSFVLEPIYTQREDGGGLARLLEIQLTEAASPDEQVDLLKRLAEIRDRRLDDADGAIDALGRAFLLAPHDGEVRQSLREAAQRSERWEKLAAVYREALATVADVDVTREVNGWLGALAEEHLGDLDEAVERYRDVLSYDEFNQAALAALGRLLERLERWDELVDVLRRGLSLGTAERSARSRLARILLRRADDPEGALELYKEILWEDPNDTEALAAMGEIASRHSILRDAVVAILTPIHQGAERWQEVVGLLLTGLDAETDRYARARSLRQVAEITEQHLDDKAKAFEYIKAAVMACPEQEDLLRELERLADGRWEDLNDAYTTLLRDVKAPDLRRELLLRGGAVARDQLGRLDLAEARYNEVLEVSPEHGEALDALEAVYESQGKIRDLIRVCEIKATLPIEVNERVALYRKIARAAKQRQDTLKAEDALMKLLELDATDLDALRALEEIYRGRSNFVRLAETMERRAQVTDDTLELASLKVALGEIRAEHMDDLHPAADAFEEALELDPSRVDAVNALEDLYERLQEWSDLARILGCKIELSDGEARLGALVKLAGIEERHLGHVDEAVSHYEAVLEMAPRNAEAVDELLRLYHKHERWAGLCQVYERKIALADNPNETMALKIKAAEVYEGRLGNLDRAAALVHEVLERTPDSQQALRLQARVFEAQGKGEAAIATYEALIPGLAKTKERALALIALGKLYLRVAENTAKALQCFRDVLALEGDNLEAGKLLKEVLYKRESWEAVVPVLEREIGRTQDKKELADLAHELAKLYRERLAKPDEAFKWLKTGFEARRDHRGIVEDLIEHYSERGSWNEVAPLLSWLVSYLEAKRLHADLAKQASRLGTLYERLGDPEKALRYFQLANQYDSQNVVNLMALGRLLYESGRYDKALQTLQGVLLLQQDIEDDALKVQMFLYLSRTCLATGDKAKAKRHLQRLLALDKDHAEGNALMAKV